MLHHEITNITATDQASTIIDPDTVDGHGGEMWMVQEGCLGR